MGIDSGVVEMVPADLGPSQVGAADLNGVFIPSGLADELRVNKGDRFEITTSTGWKAVEVGSVLPVDSVERSRIIIGTVGLVQPLLGRGTSYDAIYIEAEDAELALSAVQRAVGGAARAGPIAFRGEQVQQLLAGASASFSVGTIVALFVGAFLVYNTMTMAAVERLQEAAVLRAVGAKRRQVFALFITEGGLLGLIGSGVGIALGLVLSSEMLSRQGAALEEVFPIQITKLSVSPTILLVSGIAGVVASTVAALLPARRIAHAEVAAALGPAGAFEDPTYGSRRVITSSASGAASSVHCWQS
jgi:putative ABC transport system permease protein